MNIVHVITTLDRGGAENHLLDLASAQAEAGQTVRVVFLKGKGELVEDFNRAGIESKRVGLLSTSANAWLVNATVVHAHLPRAELWASVRRHCRKKLVVSRHLAGPFMPSYVPIVSQALSRFVEWNAQRFIAISESVREYHLKSRHLSKRAEIDVVPYGLASDLTIREGELRRSGSDYWNYSSLNIVCLARLVYQKDIETLIRAAEILRERGVNFEVHVAGSGPRRRRLMRLIRRLRLDDSVKLVGRVDDPYRLLQRATIFVLPSRFEGFGRVLLEAMASGVPIIGARNTAIAEVVRDGETGLLFATGDAGDLASKILVVSRSEELRRLLVEEGYRRLAAMFSIETMLNGTLKTYTRL